MASLEPKVKVAHVVTMDVVEYSTLLIMDQTHLIGEVTRIVKDTAGVQRAEKEGKLIRISTGEGMLLAFLDNPQAPMEWAMEVAMAVERCPDLRLRMGIHSGRLDKVVDENGHPNVAGAGVDMSQPVDGSRRRRSHSSIQAHCPAPRAASAPESTSPRTTPTCVAAWDSNRELGVLAEDDVHRRSIECSLHDMIRAFKLAATPVSAR